LSFVKGSVVAYLTDSMGSVIGLVDGDGNLVSRIVYDGFGNVESGDDGSSLGGDFRFQGQWLESESGLYYMRARDYDSETGLFLSRDPVDVQEQGVEAFNPYQFAFNNPLVFSDPTGMITITEIQTGRQIENVLQSTQSFVARQAYKYFVDQAKGVVGNLLESALQALMPNLWGYNYINKYSENIQGDLFETFVKDQICQFFGGKQGNNALVDRLWFNAEIKTDGNPYKSGFNCSNPNGEFLLNPKDSPKHPNPDFIFKQGDIKDTDGNPKAWLIGDIKRSLRELNNKVVKSKNKNQWEAIYNYAQYQNNHQYTPLTLFIVFVPGSGTQSQLRIMEKELAREATQKKVIMYLLQVIR
jgi:RHS repeat-associated protein